jgi:hypothetical protein
MIAAGMTNHRHVGGPSLAAQPYGGVAPFSVLMPPAATAASLGGTFGRYRIRLAADRSDRLAACRLPFSLGGLGFEAQAQTQGLTPISCHAELERSACAPFIKEGRMECINATSLHRKSGQMGHPAWVGTLKICVYSW